MYDELVKSLGPYSGLGNEAGMRMEDLTNRIPSLATNLTPVMPPPTAMNFTNRMAMSNLQASMMTNPAAMSNRMWMMTNPAAMSNRMWMRTNPAAMSNRMWMMTNPAAMSNRMLMMSNRMAMSNLQGQITNRPPITIPVTPTPAGTNATK